jgi:hypothetical protein
MSERLSLRSGGLCGIAYVALAFGAVTFASGSRLGEFLLQLSILPALWWVVALRSHLNRGEGGPGGLSMLFLVGYVLAGALALVQSANNAFLAVRPPNSASIVAYVNDFDSFLGIASDVPLAAAVMAAGLSILATTALPRWIGFLGLIAAAGQLILILPIVVDSGLFTDTGVVFAIAQLIFVVWLLSVSIAMLTQSARAQISPTREADVAPNSAAT